MKVIIMEMLIIVVYVESVKTLTVGITIVVFALFLKKNIEACLLCLRPYSNSTVAMESQFGLKGMRFMNQKPFGMAMLNC
jgi:hypothetical protein